MMNLHQQALPLILTMGASLLSITVANAQEQTDSSPHLEFFQAIEGAWDYKMSFPNGEVGAPTTGVVNWARRANGHTLRGYWTADGETSSTELLGYRKSDGTLVSHGYGEQGNHWNLILPEVTATSIKGRCIGTHPDGVSFEGIFEGKIDGDTYTFSINGKTESGEPHAFQGVCKRRVRTAPEIGEAARCPWTWMLGQWKVKRSDDTTASVTWEQPSEQVDVLVGRWTESDGSVLTEQVGWQPDRKQLVANAYGAEGVFFSVLFNKVDKDQMSGLYRNRNAEGKVVNGRVEINRISETEVRSKLVERDGTVLTEVFTKVQ
ncbi:MAG: hypothetical protein ACPGLY_18870 [Rubripirellula sp.]